LKIFEKKKPLPDPKNPHSALYRNSSITIFSAQLKIKAGFEEKRKIMV